MAVLVARSTHVETFSAAGKWTETWRLATFTSTAVTDPNFPASCTQVPSMHDRGIRRTEGQQQLDNEAIWLCLLVLA
eukprot:COSAG04_NODE_1127_length_8140_cov_11.952120_5_plen_77_part_00